jgi:RecA/RadA recombinase
LQLDEYNLASLLSKKGLNTLLFSDPYAKLYCTSLLARRGDVVYFDFDTTFSAYLKAGLLNAPRTDVYLPSEGKFIAMLKDVLARMEQKRGCSLVIFDSLNSFYTMYYSYYRRGEGSSGNINHLLSVLLMLLVRQGVSLGVPILATSMLRFRKEGGWKQSPASRRLLQKKSAFRFEVERIENELVVRVLEHENVPAGTTLSFDIITALR